MAAAGWDHIGRAACGSDLPGYAQALYGRSFAAPVPVMAEHLSRRLDFYLTPQGPVFGELTSYPNAGGKFTGFARRTLLQMWELWPD